MASSHVLARLGLWPGCRARTVLNLARQIALACILIFAVQVAHGAACPLDSAGNVLPGWPTTHTPSGTVSMTSGNCYDSNGTIRSATTTGLSPAASFEAQRATYEAAAESYYGESYDVTVYGGGVDTGFIYYALQWKASDGSPGPRCQNMRQAVIATPCDPPAPPVTDCAARKGKFHAYQQDTAAALGSKACTDGCEVFVNVGGVKRTDGKWGMVGQITGATCAGSNTAPEAPAPKDDNEYCATTEGGQTFCVPQGKKNCGYYNSEYVCTGNIPKDNCIQTSSGKRFCPEGTATPPAPDNGTRGVAAPADDKIVTAKSDAAAPGGAAPGEGTTQNITNVYNSGTVAGSSGAETGGTGAEGTGTGGTSGGGTGTGSGVGGAGTGDADGGTPEGEEDGDGTAGTCSGPNCALIPSELAEVETFEETATGAWSTMQAAPIVAAMSSIGTSWPSGSCPMGTIDLGDYGGSQNLGSIACDMWADNIAPVLSLVMLAFWSFLGMRIIFEA